MSGTSHTDSNAWLTSIETERRWTSWKGCWGISHLEDADEQPASSVAHLTFCRLPDGMKTALQVQVIERTECVAGTG